MPSHEPPIQAGRDAFHCVPEFSGEDGDAVERVPTGFMGGEHVREDEAALHEPGSSGRQSAPSPLQKDQSRLTSAATVQGFKARACSAHSLPVEGRGSRAVRVRTEQNLRPRLWFPVRGRGTQMSGCRPAGFVRGRLPPATGWSSVPPTAQPGSESSHANRMIQGEAPGRPL